MATDITRSSRSENLIRTLLASINRIVQFNNVLSLAKLPNTHAGKLQLKYLLLKEDHVDVPELNSIPADVNLSRLITVWSSVIEAAKEVRDKVATVLLKMPNRVVPILACLAKDETPYNKAKPSLEYPVRLMNSNIEVRLCAISLIARVDRPNHLVMPTLRKLTRDKVSQIAEAAQESIVAVEGKTPAQDDERRQILTSNKRSPGDKFSLLLIGLVCVAFLIPMLFTSYYSIFSLTPSGWWLLGMALVPVEGVLIVLAIAAAVDAIGIARVFSDDIWYYSGKYGGDVRWALVGDRTIRTEKLSEYSIRKTTFYCSNCFVKLDYSTFPKDGNETMVCHCCSSALRDRE